VSSVARYHFVTDVEVAAAPDPVWNVLVDVPGSAAWWRQVRRAEVLTPGREDGVGRRYRLDFRTGYHALKCRDFGHYRVV